MDRAELLKRNLQLQKARIKKTAGVQRDTSGTNTSSFNSSFAESPHEHGITRVTDDHRVPKRKLNSDDNPNHFTSLNSDDDHMVEERRSKLKSAIAQFHVDIKQIENHMKQLSEVYDSQSKSLQEKRAQLEHTVEKHAKAQLRLSRLQLQKAKLANNSRTELSHTG